MLPQEKLAEIKQKLETEAQDLKAKVLEHSKTHGFGENNVDDMSSEADETEDLVNDSSIAQAYRERLEEVENALNKMKAGEKYGICEKCGKPIEDSTLIVSPSRRFCEQCTVKDE